MIKRYTLKGYLLEEILAYLIRNTGYRLLVDRSQDERELDHRGNGLVVKGRGGVHQVDTLGQLMWIPAFTFPIRLFVEAKCTQGKTGIPVIRNAVGVINDINQNYAPIREGSDRLIKRYSYHYALFSTKGFAQTAVDYAMAHQVSLIDLSGPDFSDLKQFLDELTNLILNQIPDDTKTNKFVAALRLYIRQALGTWPEGVTFPKERFREMTTTETFPNQLLGSLEERLVRGTQGLGELFVGMANGPFLLVLRPRSREEFLNYVAEKPSHRVRIRWTIRGGLERQWIIEPIERPDAYSLSFGLPQALADWIFSDTSGAIRRALDAKERFLKEIIIYRYVNNQDHLYRLTYTPGEM